MSIHIKPAKEEFLQKKIQPSLFFKGETNNPFLTPRGVFIHNYLLAISDTGQNRVLIFKNFRYAVNQDADIVLGQNLNNETGRNNGTTVNASSLQYPSGLWTNGKMLIVADAWNHRVLIWHAIPNQNGQPADVVIGQPNFEANLPNVEGLSKPCSSQSLYWPYGVCSNGKELWIADTGNRRVLYFSNIPIKNFTPADKVIGQSNFNERDYDNQNAVWPYSVKINSSGAMLITDTQYYRVLFWQNWKHALQNKPPIIIGQPGIQSNGQNQFQLKPAANTLNWCYDACFYKEGLAIADTGNSRILIFDNIPEANNSSADDLVGQANFCINGETSLSLTASIKNEMYWPFSICAATDQLIVADTGNHQIIIYN